MRMSGIYVGQTGQSRVGAAKKGVSGLLAHEKCKTLKRNWRHPNHGNHLPYKTLEAIQPKEDPTKTKMEKKETTEAGRLR